MQNSYLVQLTDHHHQALLSVVVCDSAKWYKSVKAKILLNSMLNLICATTEKEYARLMYLKIRDSNTRGRTSVCRLLAHYCACCVRCSKFSVQVVIFLFQKCYEYKCKQKKTYCNGQAKPQLWLFIILAITLSCIFQKFLIRQSIWQPLLSMTLCSNHIYGLYNIQKIRECLRKID